MTASTLTYPLDLIRTVLGVKVDGDASKAWSIFGCGKQIYMRDGLKGLFRGWPTTMLVSKWGLKFRGLRLTLELKCRPLISWGLSSRSTIKKKMPKWKISSSEVLQEQ
jgi:hypothetical protein